MPAAMVSTTAIAAIGRVIQKIDRQVHRVRYPPAIGPTAVRPPLTPKKMASALPRSPTGKAATTTASAAGIISAADRPWVTRKTIIHAPAKDVVGVAPHSPEDTANPTIPINTTDREPSTSAIRPPRAKPAANARM